ncbi:tetratricopeptide repeat protein [Pedobacter sp. PWIIR3]
MKQLALILLFFISTAVIAQEKSPVNLLVEEGIKLHDAGKYPEAIAKYKEALKLEPSHPSANYEIAFTLFSTNAGKEAIPYLNEVVKQKTNVQVAAYDMLGSIYDDQKQADKAVEYFQLGIKANPKYQRIYYNLAVTYGRQGKDKDAMTYLTTALKLDPTHASSHRLFGDITKADPSLAIYSLLAYCNFLMLEPATDRSVAVYKDIKAILDKGVAKDGKDATLTITPSKDTDLSAINMSITLSSSLPSQIPGITEVEVLEQRLKMIFGTTGELSKKRKDKDFFWTFYADYFYELSKSEYMPLFAHIINFTANRDANNKWISDNQKLLIGLGEWEKQHPRNVN